MWTPAKGTRAAEIVHEYTKEDSWAPRAVFGVGRNGPEEMLLGGSRNLGVDKIFVVSLNPSR